MMATLLKSTELLDILLENAADPTIYDRRGNNCWHIAVLNGDVRSLQSLNKWLELHRTSAAASYSWEAHNFDGEYHELTCLSFKTVVSLLYYTVLAECCRYTVYSLWH